VTRDQALEALLKLAAGIHEDFEPAATAKLLERIAARDQPELKAALLEVAVIALLRESRGAA